MDKLLVLESDDLAFILGELANQARISASKIKKARSILPSFSAAKWSDLVPNFGLPNDLTLASLDSLSIVSVYLLPSFHVTAFQVAWHIQDAYQERIAQDREEARIRIFDAYLIPVVALFQGRIIDKPEHPMTSTAYSRGGEVEHELVLEGNDTIAHLFLELLSAAETNKQANFQGLRSSPISRYDPIKQGFAFDEEIVVNNTRDVLFGDMIHVTNKVFTVILFAYIEGLAATAKESRNRPPEPPTGSSPAQQPLRNHTYQNTSSHSRWQNHSGSRKSTAEWELALDFAKQCLSKFQVTVSSVEDIEKQSSEAIALLTKSVRSIPRVSHYSGKDDPSTSVELKEVACRIVQAEHKELLKQMNTSLD